MTSGGNWELGRNWMVEACNSVVIPVADEAETVRMTPRLGPH